MASGGARNRVPQPQENSERSERRGFKLTALPAEGYQGAIPDFPLPIPTDREIELWSWAWRTPQASAWALPSESWRVRTVAMWVRVSVRCEEPDAAASTLAQLHRFADQIGMTTAGLSEMGWKVAVDEVAVKAAEADERQPVQRERRLRSVNDGES